MYKHCTVKTNGEKTARHNEWIIKVCVSFSGPCACPISSVSALTTLLVSHSSSPTDQPPVVHVYCAAPESTPSASLFPQTSAELNNSLVRNTNALTFLITLVLQNVKSDVVCKIASVFILFFL